MLAAGFLCIMSALGSACFDDDGRDEDRDAHAGVSDHGMIYHIYI
jgi:hypothetical protein